MSEEADGITRILPSVDADKGFLAGPVQGMPFGMKWFSPSRKNPR